MGEVPLYQFESAPRGKSKRPRLVRFARSVSPLTLQKHRLPPATRSELFTPFQPSIDFPSRVKSQTSVFKGNRLSQEPGYSSHHIASGWDTSHVGVAGVTPNRERESVLY